MREGSLEAPTRHAIAWQDPDFTDMAKIEAEMHRVFDICHGCRRCFNLCDSFPRLFDLVDNSPTEELDSVPAAAYKDVVDACTLCDMCYMTKCPYVPPHEFNLDFPHLMLRYRAAELKAGKVSRIDQELVKTDRNGQIGAAVAPLANWATDTGNGLTRPLLEKTAGIDREAALPKYTGRTFTMRAKRDTPEINKFAPAFRAQGGALRHLLRQLPQPADRHRGARRAGAQRRRDRGASTPPAAACRSSRTATSQQVAKNARKVAAELTPWIEKGYDVIALVPSCALMLKFEWPLILPGG